MIVLGFDPGFASFGYAAVELGEVVDKDKLLAMGVIRTKKTDKKHKVRAVDDNQERTAQIARTLDGIFEMHGPVLVCAEAMSFPRNASVAGKMHLAWGVLTTIRALRGVAMLQVTPQELKKGVCGTHTASKYDIQSKLYNRYPTALSLVKGLPNGQLEHPYDALGAIVTCLDSEEVRFYRRLAHERTGRDRTAPAVRQGTKGRDVQDHRRGDRTVRANGSRSRVSRAT